MKPSGGKRGSQLERDQLKPDRTPASIDQARAEERVNAFQRGGRPSVAAVEPTSMPMVVTNLTVSGNPTVSVDQSFIDLSGHAREAIIGQHYFMPAGPEMERLVRMVMRRRYTQLKLKEYR